MSRLYRTEREAVHPLSKGKFPLWEGKSLLTDWVKRTANARSKLEIRGGLNSINSDQYGFRRAFGGGEVRMQMRGRGTSTAFFSAVHLWGGRERAMKKGLKLVPVYGHQSSGHLGDQSSNPEWDGNAH